MYDILEERTWGGNKERINCYSF